MMVYMATMIDFDGIWAIFLLLKVKGRVSYCFILWWGDSVQELGEKSTLSLLVAEKWSYYENIRVF